MDPTALLQELRAQGPATWLAAAAVALGAALLVAAAVLQLRRMRPRLRPARPARRPAGTVPPTAHADYAAQAASAAPAPPPAAPAPGPDPALTRRLADAVSRLEALHAALAAAEPLAAESALKAPASHVEYVFRTGEA